ncbi:MAG: cation-translocating P-type ATPase [Acidimicrobiales bacterium]
MPDDRVPGEPVATDGTAVDPDAGTAPWATTVAEVAARHDVDPIVGLEAGEAAGRLDRVGRNELTATEAEPWWRRLLAQFTDPLVVLLLAAIVISPTAWLLEGADEAPFEAIVIAVVVILNAVIGLWQEARAEAAVAALARLAAPMARVRRDGITREIPAGEVVPGDVLLLAEGDAVCADARLIEVASLRVAEAALTGESEPVQKRVEPVDGPTVVGDRVNMVFSATAVSAGRGEAIVTSTAMATEIGRIATMLEGTEAAPTPLQREIALVGRVLGIAVVAIALVVLGAIFATSDIDSGGDVMDALLVAVSLAVAAVPEGLPAILAVVLALGVQRMAGRNAIVKKLPSVETLGSASVICSDKTGTLTRNEMTIERIVTASGEAELVGGSPGPSGDGGAELRNEGAVVSAGPLRDEIELVVRGGSLANDASLHHADGQLVASGDPTETAFLVAEAELGTADARRRYRRVHELPFSSDRKMMSTVEVDETDPGHPLVVSKGAPDVLLEHCTHEWIAGDAVVLSAERRERIEAGIEAMADDAMRTLAVAFRRLDDPGRPMDGSLEEDLVFVGTVGIVDPPRAEAREAIAEAHAAGIRIVMITGDHPRTAGRIAQQLGITARADDAVTGVEIDAMDDATFERTVREVAVFARVAPEHKLRIVEVLRSGGDIVAMTGDGVNDAPALKAADIGVAMGITGTEVSKEAAEMILADDDFATIVTAVREGRSIFSGIRKFLRYLLSSNTGEVLTMLIGVLLAAQLALDETGEAIAAPLLATQILWINLLTDTTLALALGVDPPVDDVMDGPPRGLTDRVIDREMQLGVLLTGFVMAVAALVALDVTLVGGWLGGDGDIVEARTMAFTTLVVAQLFNCVNSRSSRTSALRGLFTNRLLWGAIALSLALQVLVVHLPALNEAFETTGLSVGQWLLCTALASTVLVVDEVKKLALRHLA